MSDEIKLFNSLLSLKKIDNLDDICSHYSEALAREFSAKDICVYSYSTHRINSNKSKPLEHKRVLFGKSLSKYDELSLKLFEQYSTNSYVLEGSNGKHLCAYKFLSTKSQICFIFFTLDKPLSEKLKDTMIKSFEFTSNIYNKFLVYASLEELVYKDEVSGLFNQRKLSIDLDDYISKHKKNGKNFSVLFIDIDHFKQVNDSHGHLIGTEMLTEVSALIKRFLKDSDSCYRYGGDEFVAILPDSDNENALEVGQKILDGIKNESIVIDEITNNDEVVQHKFNISVSIGVSNFPLDAIGKAQILSMADRMMYEAKKGGRGRVFSTGSAFPKERTSSGC